ncbi:DNA mismatch repair endonuclease MutL [Desulfurivibrio alkaliphilus]|uniref:DNA mismatch repair protein MutL n=1 Tax=Desulfurivibrio alkaliphilus (strain DSM 19089 / UNIQEM U267 / AHT2) TaxID=589865 RepID=D6Z3A8_DESAT|nr:DNA mismatch repair endonuclease MutL [Desulfurivibrio alkaliphilus]ADH86033.1 DNA mismatch repair protein MutL [Desulfurivibrio alkaliphilus AHT 2]
MSRIRVLPENLANQIAAGEVVERPASVVKELLENAVDAGARNISVQVEGRAVGLLRVSDDGSGMDADDLLLALERHATSKIADAEGLAAISTLGFRGEALPSIASVARLLLSSRPQGADLGTLVEVRFGTVRRVQETGAAQGTVVEVRDLFANVPARRKFLKSPRTELYHVEECVKNCGLAFPGLGLHYQVDGRTVLQWPAGVDDAAGRIRRLLGKRGELELVPVGEPGEGTVSEPVVTGLLLTPEETPATGARLRLFVNGRPVRDRMLSHAVAEGLHHQLLRGRQPAGVLFLRVDPATVDVNVHPTKQEIRFRQSGQVHDAVRAAVRKAVELHEQEKSRRLFGSAGAAVRKPPAPEAGQRAPAAESAAQGRLFRSATAAGGSVAPAAALGAASPSPPETVLAINSAEAPGDYPSSAVAQPPPAVAEPPAPPIAPEPRAAASPAIACGLEDAAPQLLGQVLHSYIICATADGMLAIDQHAAHERLLYERLLAQYNERGLARQALLFPAVLECSPAEAAVLEARGGEIARLGLGIETFGGHSYLIKAVPALLASHSPTEILAGVLSRYLDDGTNRGGGDGRLEAVLAGMACKAAVKAGQVLAPAEMQGLLKEMQGAGIFSRCPHGRPVVRHFGARELERWFNR